MNIFILARHGETARNAEMDADPMKSHVQGTCLEMPLNTRGELQARALGHALARYVLCQKYTIARIESSDAVRAATTRDLALAEIETPWPIAPPTPQLRELGKGNWEGCVRGEVYTEKAMATQYTDWHFRHGTEPSKTSLNETAYEAGSRWHSWLNSSNNIDTPPRSAILAFGHDLVTSYGLTLATAPRPRQEALPPLETSRQFRQKNGAALVVAKVAGRFAIIDQITPTQADVSAVLESNTV